MRKIQVKIIGSGTESDPYRVDLPTWRMIECGTDKLGALTNEEEKVVAPILKRVGYDLSKLTDEDRQVLEPIAEKVRYRIAHPKPEDMWAIIEVPDDEWNGKINRKRLKEKYKGSKWETHEPDIGKEELLE
jgi:hypothetical protein